LEHGVGSARGRHRGQRREKKDGGFVGGVALASRWRFIGGGNVCIRTSIIFAQRPSVARSFRRYLPLVVFTVDSIQNSKITKNEKNHKISWRPALDAGVLRGEKLDRSAATQES
jgi:hypothetical protein